MNTITKTALTLMVLGSIPTVASAVELKGGLQATIARPMSNAGDFLDKKIGYGLGGHMLIGLSGGHAIVPRIDYTIYKNSGLDTKLQTLQVGADYDYYISGRANDGLYAGVGVGYEAAKFQTHGLSNTPKAFAWDVNAGYQFSQHFGVELRYSNSRLKPKFNGVESTVKTPVISTSLIYRF